MNWKNVTVVLVALLIVIFLFARGGNNGGDIDNGPDNGGENTETAIPAVSDSDWSKGNPDSDVVLIEYGDFQCPACAAYHPLVSQIESELGEELRIVYRHFPLRSIHPNADVAARASEAAGVQGKFWEMHDLLFENQDEWARENNPRDIFAGYATELELDVEAFREHMDSDEAREAVNESFEAAFKAGLNSTPSFVLNGNKINNPSGFDDFKALIEAALLDAELREHAKGNEGIDQLHEEAEN